MAPMCGWLSVASSRASRRTGAPLGVGAEHARKGVDRDVAPKLGIVGPEHLAHATGPES